MTSLNATSVADAYLLRYNRFLVPISGFVSPLFILITLITNTYAFGALRGWTYVRLTGQDIYPQPLKIPLQQSQNVVIRRLKTWSR